MKIAIFNYDGMDGKVGGPKGYLYNLYQGYKESNLEAPTFLGKTTENNVGIKKENKSETPSELHSLLAFVKRGLIIWRKYYKKLSDYDVIHVHSSEDCYYLKQYARFKGKIILTSHRPESLVEERMGIQKRITKKKYFFLSILYNHVEKSSYQFADGFIFPSENAMRIYNDFPGFAEASHDKPIHYVMTGTQKKECTISRAEYRASKGIGEKDFVISYIGRHNYIKGYDRIVEAYHKLKNNNIKVVVAGGVSAEITPPNDADYWNELGYISDPQNLMYASDIVVVPNRNTYYDLVIVEALSTGRIVVTSNTGGNIDIAKHTKGLQLFDNESGDFTELVLKIKDMNFDELKKLEEQNIDFFVNNGTISSFARSHQKELLSISKDIL